MTRIEARFPFGGRSDATAKADQPQLTTHDCENVVGWHPFTGRQQGGQRAGLSPYLAGGNPPLAGEGVPVQWGGTFSRHEPAHTYKNLGIPLAGGSASSVDLQRDWAYTSPDQDDSWDVISTRDGDTYWLSGESIVVKRNASGVELYTVPLPVSFGHRAARTMALDEDGNLYAGSSSDTSTEGAYVWKFVPRINSFGKETGMDLAWETFLEDASDVVAIRYYGARLYVGYNEFTNKSAIVVLDAIAGTEPILSVPFVVPNPLGDIDAALRGVYFTCPPNPQRGSVQAPSGIGVSNIDWTPYDLSDFDQRLHFWIDAAELGDASVANGTPISIVPDRRFVEGLAIYDDTDRSLLRSRFYYAPSDTGNQPPTFGSVAGGVLPGIVFDPTAGTAQNSSQFFDLDNGSGLTNRDPVPPGAALPVPFGTKANVFGKLPKSTGAWPFSPYGRFITWLFRWTPGSPPAVVWTTGVPWPYAPVNNWLALVVNWASNAPHSLPVSGGSGTYNPDWWQIATPKQLDGGISFIKSINGDQKQLKTFPSAFTARAQSGPEVGFAMVTLVREPDGSGSLRVNGEEVYAFIADEIDTYEPIFNPIGLLPAFKSGIELWGNRLSFEQITPENRHLFEFDSFNGALCECITVFATSSSDTSPHDEVFAASGSPSATDYERVEGYLAHKWGVAPAVLEASHPFLAAPPSGSGGFVGTTATETNAALKSPYGILGKLQPGLAGVQWAITGAGMGYTVKAAEDGAVFCAGPRAVPEGYPDANEDGPQARILLKGFDRGLSFEWTEPSYGEIRIADNPPNGATLSIQDTAGGITRFVFHDTADPMLAGHVWVDTGSGSSDSIQYYILLEFAVPTIGTADIFADAPVDNNDNTFPRTIFFWARTEPDAVVRAIATTGMTSGDEEIVVVAGMTGPGVYPDATWERRVRDDFDLENASMKMDTDEVGDLYVPMAYKSKENHVVKYASAGTNGRERELWTHRIGGTPTGFDVHALALDRRVVDRYPATGPEHMWVASSAHDASGELDSRELTQHKLRLISSTPKNSEARSTVGLAIAGGNLYSVKPNGTSTLIRKSAFSPNSTWVRGFALFGRVYFVDAGNYILYDMRTGAVRDWVAATSGEIPKGAVLGCVYRGRAVLARANGDPYNIHASATGDPLDWNTNPKIPVFTKAFSGSSLQTAKNPDVVNALIPFFDDVLIVGGDRSIVTFQGDLSELGSINLFTTATGIAFGDAWALDPEGFIYFYGSRGGVWAMAPASEGRAQPPIELTDSTLNKEFQAINLSLYRIQLLWDQDQKTLHVYQVRRSASTQPAIVRHWIWEKRARAWWPMRVNSEGMQPYTCWVGDGNNPDDRYVIIGCEDGRLRYWNPNTAADELERIYSYVLIGPILPQDPMFETRLKDLEITTALGPVNYEVFVSDNPDDLGQAVLRGTVKPGFSGSLRRRARGGTMWIRLSSGSQIDTWALEKVFVDLEAAGRRKVRS